jgi:hypothetical protein
LKIFLEVKMDINFQLEEKIRIIIENKISGDNFNAATLAEDAINKGAKAVIVEDKNFENSAKNIRSAARLVLIK